VFQIFLGQNRTGKDPTFIITTEPIALKEWITAEQLIAAFTSDHGFVIARTHATTHVPLRDRERVVERPLGMPSCTLERRSVQFLLGQSQQLLLGSGTFGHPFGNV